MYILGCVEQKDEWLNPKSKLQRPPPPPQCPAPPCPPSPQCPPPPCPPLVELSSMPANQFLCPGQSVSFTCTITVHEREGSINWFSVEYIGAQHARLTISELHTEAYKIVDGITTRAKLLNYFPCSLGEERVKTLITSRLQISNYSSSSVVTCSAPDDSFNQSITLQLLGKYNIERAL